MEQERWRSQTRLTLTNQLNTDMLADERAVLLPVQLQPGYTITGVVKGVGR